MIDPQEAKHVAAGINGYISSKSGFVGTFGEWTEPKCWSNSRGVFVTYKSCLVSHCLNQEQAMAYLDYLAGGGKYEYWECAKVVELFDRHLAAEASSGSPQVESGEEPKQSTKRRRRIRNRHGKSKSAGNTE